MWGGSYQERGSERIRRRDFVLKEEERKGKRRKEGGTPGE